MKYIAYYRVSTSKQGRSKLGLEAQRETVKNFIQESELIAEYIEVESGKNNNRVELNKAIRHAKESNSKLIIAKLDRLSRDVEFIFNLKNNKVDFVAADIPDANTLTIGVFATVAQHERERISLRIKDAFKARRARGLEHPKNNNLTDVARKQGREVQKLKALEHHKDYINYILLLHKNNNTLRNIADILNKEGKRTQKGKEFTATQVMRIIKNYQK